MKKITLFAAAALMSYASIAQNWKNDKAHSHLNFSITHLMVSDVDGTFKNVDATIISAKPDFSDAVFELTADVNSINTDNEKRDEHLKTPEYFDVAKYPTITFRSTSFKNVGGKNYKLTGNLTMHGVTKPVTLDVVFSGTAVHPYTKATLAGFKFSGKVSRLAFGIGKDTDTKMLGDEITISASGEFTK